MEGLKSLKNYPMAEAIYYYVFEISEEELKNSSPSDIIRDYEHLKENVQEILYSLRDRDRVILQQLLEDKMSTSEVGKRHGISQARVSEIARKTLQRLRHPSRKRLLDGTLRQARAEANARREHETIVDALWDKVSDEIERQKSKQAAHMDTVALLGIKDLSLTPICERKLEGLEIRTIGELLERFPYDSETNGLTGLAIADGIDEDDYREIWGALFLAGALVHTPELPDFEALKEAEQATMAQDEALPVECKIAVSELGLSVKSYNFLMRGGISTLGELLDRLRVDASRILELSVDDVAEGIYKLKICHADRNIKEIATCVRKKLREIYPELALDEHTDHVLEELNDRVKKISNENSYIRQCWLGAHSCIYYRTSYKSFPFRKTNMFDSRRRSENIYGKNMIYFNLPEELDELIKFVEHDEKLYREAHPEG